MINAEFDKSISTLQKFYKSIQQQHLEHHGVHYTSHHDAIVKCLKDGSVYKELGTHQGATAAAAVLGGATDVTLVDIDHSKINPNLPLFEKYCKSKNINLNVIEADSRSQKARGRCDTLLIDSCHTYEHCVQELYLHSKWVNNYIIIHDTAANTDLYEAVLDFTSVLENLEWNIIEYSKFNVGYTIIKKS